MQKKNLKRISVEVDENFLLDLKKAALFRNMTLKRYVTAILLEQLVKDRFYAKPNK